MTRAFLVFSLFVVVSCSSDNHLLVADFVASRETSLELYLYPSTIRMLNLGRNQDFDEIVKDIRKARIFKLDSGTVSPMDLRQLSDVLKQKGYDDLLTFQRNDLDLQVLSLEKPVPEFLIISMQKGSCLLVEIEGLINVARIPKLVDSFEKNAYLDILHLTEIKK